jgi:hypothetical protein
VAGAVRRYVGVGGGPTVPRSVTTSGAKLFGPGVPLSARSFLSDLHRLGALAAADRVAVWFDRANPNDGGQDAEHHDDDEVR